MAQTREHPVVTFVMSALSYFNIAGAGGPGVLLRVPRSSASSLTCAKRLGRPLPDAGMPKAAHASEVTVLTDIPNIGQSIAQDLIGLGIVTPAQVATMNPVAIYDGLRTPMG